MKIFISQPMRGKTQEEILSERERGIAFIKEHCPLEDIEVIDTYFKDFNGNRLQFLGKSIMEGLAKADIALFIGDFEEYDGCSCEHFIAVKYGVPVKYFR